MAVCNGFAKLGVRGSSVLFSSGDSSIGNGRCLTNEGMTGQNSCPYSLRLMRVLFPRSQRSLIMPNLGPYMTAVGGRANQQNCTQMGGGFFWGGFSNHFDGLFYQSNTVQAFMDTL